MADDVDTNINANPNRYIASLVSELLEACVHACLHNRGVYPKEVFERRRVLGVAVPKARHPKLAKYIADAFVGIHEMLSRGKMLALAVVILGKKKKMDQQYMHEGAVNVVEYKPLERIVFSLGNQ